MTHVDDDEDCGDEFVGYNEWAVATLGVELFTDFVYDYDDGERGVFVAEDIAPQTRVVSVPFTSLLTLEWLQEQAIQGHPVYSTVALFQPLIDRPRGAWDPEIEDDLLAMALLCERFVARESSRWHPHLQLLPKSYDNLLFFSEQERRALAGSNTFFLAQQMQRKVQADYEQLSASAIPSIIGAAHSAAPDMTETSLANCFSLEQYQWALSTIWSRFVSLKMAEEGSLPVLKAMAPVFDMLNHDPYAEVSHGYNAETHALEVVTHQHVGAGTQLCINYGAMSNHKLITLYGFVVPENPFDTIDLWMPMDPTSTPLYAAKAQALRDLGIDHETTAFELSADEEDLDPTLLLTARVVALECKNEQELLESVAKVKCGEIVSADNEVRALSSLIYTLEATLAQYEMSVEEEENKEGNEADEVRTRHLWMARAVRESDQGILASTIDQLKAMLWSVLQEAKAAQAKNTRA